MTGLLLSDDLIFTSRITGTARALGAEVRVAKTAEAILKLAGTAPPPAVILDLANPGLDLPALVVALQALGVTRLVAYGSHVDVASLKAARVAGCDPVLPRSKFVEELPTRLLEWLDPDASAKRR